MKFHSCFLERELHLLHCQVLRLSDKRTTFNLQNYPLRLGQIGTAKSAVEDLVSFGTQHFVNFVTVVQIGVRTSCNRSCGFLDYHQRLRKHLHARMPPQNLSVFWQHHCGECFRITSPPTKIPSTRVDSFQYQ